LISLTVFDLHGVDRLNEWKRFRDSLESSTDPFKDVVDLWGRAPFVNPYLDPNDPKSWPDPWKLVIDLRLDNLAICLGMLYTLQLTQRFMGENLEIHMSMSRDKKTVDYFLSVGNQCLLDYQSRSVRPYDPDLNKIWSSKKIK
jgi:hypothetical protein